MTLTASLREALREGAQSGVFAVLVGRSSAGKTRCAYEAVAAALPNGGCCTRQTSGEVRDFADSVTPRTVVWLDELQDYLHDGLPVSTVASLLRSAEPVIVIGTLWPDLYQEFTAAPEPGKEDRYRNERRLLKLAHVFDVASHLSTGERRRALVAAESDPRIAVALGSSDYPMTAVLAAAPELARRWENAPDPYCETVITAAIDYRRLGVQAPLLPHVLRAAMSGYLSPAEQAAAQEGWFEASLAYATRPCAAPPRR